jgi:Rod binding domain-containing protein
MIPPIPDSPIPTTTARPDPVARRRADFAAALGRSLGEAGLGEADRARRAAEEFVATAFVQPLLKELRAGIRTPPPFGPGPAERQFRALTDTTLAREIVQSKRFGLVDRIADDLRRVGRGAWPSARTLGAEPPGTPVIAALKRPGHTPAAGGLADDAP